MKRLPEDASNILTLLSARVLKNRTTGRAEARPVRDDVEAGEALLNTELASQRALMDQRIGQTLQTRTIRRCRAEEAPPSHGEDRRDARANNESRVIATSATPDRPQRSKAREVSCGTAQGSHRAQAAPTIRPREGDGT